MTSTPPHSQSPPSVAIPRLWTVFVFGWLLVLGATVFLLVREEPVTASLVSALVAIVALAALYLWLALAGAIGANDLTSVGRAPDWRRRVLVLAAMTGIVLVLIAMKPATGMWWQMMYPVIGAGLALPLVGAAVAMGVMLLLALVAAWLAVGKLEVMLLIQIAIGGGAVAIRQLTLTIAQLQAARTQLARRAVDEERLRIARDLHDLLGHGLSLIVLKSELARRRLPVSPDLAAAELRDIEHAAREALREVRATVAGYRQPTLQSEFEAARQLLAATGIDVAITDAAGPMPPEVDGLLAWAVREGVTNVVRHSCAAHCAIDVQVDDRTAKVTVYDDGAGLAPAMPERVGNGLAGLEERAAAFGGRVIAGPKPLGGFCLTMEAPLNGAHQEEG